MKKFIIQLRLGLSGLEPLTQGLEYIYLVIQAFFGNSSSPIFFVANRGHHADIGGLVPGSLAPQAVSLDQVFSEKNIL